MRHNRLLTLTALTALAALAQTSCDDGPIYEEVHFDQRKGSVVKFQGELSGTAHWPETYTIALAGFADGSNYAVVAKSVPHAQDGAALTVTLAGVTENVETVELCVIDKLRGRVTTFAKMDMAQSADTILFDAGSVDVSMFGSIQRDVFGTTCAHCHGGADRVAAGLNLTAGVSYDAIVGKSSRKCDSMLIAPGKSSESLLYLILSTDLSSTWHYDHSREVLSTDRLCLIQQWIDSGAPRD